MLRLRTWVLLVLVLGLSTGGVLWIQRCQVARYGREFLAEAQAAEKSGRLEEAEDRYAQAIGVAPETVDAYVGLAAILRQTHRDEEANYWLERLLAANPKSLAAYVARGRAQLARGRRDEADADAQRALALAATDPAALALARDVDVAHDQPDKARARGRSIVEQAPDSPEGYLALADIELRAGRRHEAIGILDEAIAKRAGTPALRFARINLLLDEGQLAEAKKTIAAADAEFPNGLAQYIDARIAVAGEDWIKAVRTLEAIREMVAPQPLYSRQVEYWLAECHGRLGDPERQIGCYEQAIKTDPLWAPPRVGLAIALLRGGHVAESLRAFDAAAGLADLPREFWIERARAILLAYLRLPSDRRHWAAVEMALRQAEQANPQSLAASLLRADFLLAQDQTAAAEKLLGKARDQDQQRIEPWVHLAFLAASQGHTERAAKLLKEAEERVGDGVLLRLGRADCLLPQESQAAAEFLRGLADVPSSWPDKDRVALWRELASRSLALGDVKQALRLYGRIADKLPDDLAAQQQLFEIASDHRDSLAMGPSLDRIAGIAEKSAFWHCDRAAWLEILAKSSAYPQLFHEQALEHLKLAEAQRPAWARVPRLAAAVFQRQGNIGAAIASYEKAIELGDVKPATVRPLVQLLCQRQRYAEAEQFARRLELAQAVPAGLERVLPGAFWQRKEYQRDLSAARESAKNSNDPWDQLWLGERLATAGTRAVAEGQTAEGQRVLDEAQQALRRAVELTGSLPAAWVALVKFLVATGRKDEARQALATATERITEELSAAQVALALAYGWESLGDQAEAARYYARAVEQAPDDATAASAAADFYLRTGKRAAAESLLVRVTDGKSHAPRESIMAARRTLAASLASHGGYQNLRKALDHVEQNLHDCPGRLADLRAKAVIYAAWPARQRRLEAIGLFEQILNIQQSLLPEDELQLVELYALAGDQIRGDDRICRLAEDHPQVSRYLAAQVRSLLRGKRFAEADAVVKRLEALAPGDFSTVRYRAEILVGLGNCEAALQAVRAARSGNHDSAIRELASASLEEFAEKLQGQGQSAAAGRFLATAEELWRDAARSKADAAMGLAAFLARRGRGNEALEIVQRTWQDAPLPATAQALATVVQRGGCQSPELQQASDVALGLLREHGREGLLLGLLASVRVAEENDAEAEKLFREALAVRKDSADFVPLNNLAFFLALKGKELDVAASLIEQAVQIAGPLATLLETRGMVHSAKRQYREALADLDAAIADTPTAVRYFRRAEILRADGQVSAAREALRKAAEQGLRPELLQPRERPVYEKLRAANL